MNRPQATSTLHLTSCLEWRDLEDLLRQELASSQAELEEASLDRNLARLQGRCQALRWFLALRQQAEATLKRN